MPLTFAPATEESIPVYVVEASDLDEFRAGRPAHHANWIDAAGFAAGLSETLLLPGTDGRLEGVVAGYGTSANRDRGRFHLAACAAGLPAGTYRLESPLTGDILNHEALGWLLAGYSYDRYRQQTGAKARLVAPEAVDAAKLEAIAAGEALTRDLINTPAGDMGPEELEDAMFRLAGQFGAQASAVRGDDLLRQNLPMIHAVGRASAQAPRLLEMNWGDAGPCLTLVGKGVCFDTGGLDIKPAASMGLMKKDMGGAATVLGLARMVMALRLPIRLRVLIPAVENSVAGNAFRPQDILTARNGLTVEVNNTDAEGRLVLADALALADEGEADCIVSMATLTGAARVAVGPDIAPFYATTKKAAAVVARAGERVADPVWQMPFHEPYEAMLEPGVADLDNAPKGGMAGSVTAALFLRRFVDKSPYLHFDIYGWQPTAAPARPKGGVGQGARAILDALPDLLGF